MIRTLMLTCLSCLACLCLTCIVAPSLATAQSGTSLRWQFPVGRIIKVAMTQQMENSQKIGEETIETEMVTKNLMVWEVVDVSDAGVATVKSEIKRMTMTMETPSGKVEIDSDSDAELEGMAKAVGESLLKLVGKPFMQTMDARGEVISVDFPESFAEVTKVMGKEAMEKLIKNASPVFPDRELGEGESWSQESLTPMQGGMGAMKIDSTYTYTGQENVDGKMLDVVDMDMKMGFEMPEDSPTRMELTDQKTSGKMYFDSVKGHTSKIRVEQTITMDVTMESQSITQTMTNRTEGTFELIEEGSN